MRTILLLIGLLAVPVILFAQPAPDTLWTRVIGGAGDDVPSVIRQTADGGYIIAGKTRLDTALPWKLYLVKLDSLGNAAWQRQYPGHLNCDDTPSDILEVHGGSGGYIIPVSTTCYDSSDSSLISVLRVNGNGDTAWFYQKEFAHEVSPSAYLMAEFSNGFLLTYTTTQNVTRYRRIGHGAIRFSLAGDTIWTRYAIGVIDYGFYYHYWNWGGISIFKNGKVIVSDSEQYFQQWQYYREGWSRVAVLKYSADGDSGQSIIRTNVPSGPILALDDGGWIIYSPNVYRYDSTGNLLWQNDNLGGFTDLCAATRGGYGIINNATQNGTDILFRCYDTTGTLLWQRSYGGSGVETAVALDATEDSGYVVLGTTTSFGNGTQIYVVKTGHDHYVAADKPQSIVPESFALSAYPNPFNPATTLHFSLPKAGLTTLTIYDLNGRVVRVLQDGMMEAGEHRLSFDGSLFPSGIYFARISAHGFEATHKLVLLK